MNLMQVSGKGLKMFYNKEKLTNAYLLWTQSGLYSVQCRGTHRAWELLTMYSMKPPMETRPTFIFDQNKDKTWFGCCFLWIVNSVVFFSSGNSLLFIFRSILKRKGRHKGTFPVNQIKSVKILKDSFEIQLMIHSFSFSIHDTTFTFLVIQKLVIALIF